ncbi:MAG: glycoside hydrolase family 2 protein, partial [Candidatus Fimenecus sp.]
MRRITNLNSDWYFLKAGTRKDKTPRRANGKWEQVNLPHTWNNMDGQDGGFDFYRGACWYFKTIKVDLESDEEAYLEFQGVSSIAAVFINGKKAGVHKGGFSTFRVNITPYLKRGKAKIAVMADNRESKEVYPQTADFTFFGGIYRDANLITVKKSHFALDYCGGKGISVTPTLCDDLKKADIEIKTYITGKADTKVEFSLDGQTVTTDGDAVITLENPHLWDGIYDPYLYTLTCRLIKDGEAVDELTVDFGVRKFSVDSEKGFFLNNRPYPLRGVSRHQDRLDKGWAISKADHEEDIKLIREVGANTIRLAHYQHDDYFYTLCDRAGLLVWAEIPFISVFMPSKEAYDNTMSQMRELVIQAYNHPSIFTWGIANEITIGEETPELIKNLKDLNDLCHKLDKSRPTTMANVTMVPEDSQLNTITDILAYNHYFGWYMGCVDDNAPWLDNFHKNYPNICLGLSEYGCEGILAYHNDNPQMQDYSEEYQAYYHEKMLETFATRDYLWATYVWNMFDFASDMRDEGGVKGRNNKGLVTFDRKIKKDSFFIYKAYWSEEKFVHLCSRRYVNRTNEKVDIKVY